MESGSIIQWFVKEGDYVKENEPLFEMETDKVTTEVTAPVSGIITIVNGELEREIAVGETVGYILTTEGQAERVQLEQEQGNRDLPEGKRIIASPYARKLAREYKIDLSKIKDRLLEKRIIAQDVLNFINLSNGGDLQTSEGVHENPTVQGAKTANSKDITLTPMRKAIVGTLQRSAESIIPVTITRTVQVDQLVSQREQLKQEGISVTVNDYIIYAVSKALQKHKHFNSYFSDNKIVQYQDINIGFAVAVENGLMVPVISRSSKKSIGEISKERKRLVEAVRNQNLSLEDCQNGTFTISNLGEYEVDTFSPVIYPTQAGIIGIGSIQKRPVVKEDRLDIGYLLQLSFVFDHRVSDGAPAAEFLGDICKGLENPLKMLIEM